MNNPIATDSNWEKYIWNKALYAAGNAFHEILRDRKTGMNDFVTKFASAIKKLEK